MKKTIFFTVSISLLAALPAIAQVGNVWVDFQNYANDLQLYLKDNISDTLLPVESEAQTAINSYNGELNIPNPVAARRSLIDDIVINSLSDNFENNPAVNAQLSANEVDRQLTRSIAVGILGEEAQIRSRNKLENLENSLENTTREIQKTRVNSRSFLDDITETAINSSSPLSPLLGQSQSRLIELQLQNNQIENEQSKIIEH
ncbi:MAG: hypothetical protein AAFS12_13905 [Cyanobacteria bacterium J06632_19]